jgi:ABC-type transport system substrate-binding protein
LTPQYGGTLRILSIGQRGYDNYGAPTIAIPYWNPMGPSPMVETLIYFDQSGNPIPNLASGWEWGDDYLSLTLTLNEGVKFHDGTDFDAEAVKYNVEAMMASTAPWLKTITSVDVIDPHTVRFNLKSYDNLLMGNLIATGGAMVSPTSLQTYGVDYNMLHPVGTGAYQFASFQRNVTLKSTRFDDYWRGTPYLDGIEVYFMSDPVSAKAAFLAGEGDILARISPNDAADLQSKGNYNFDVAKCELFQITGDGSHEDSPFADIKVRQAVSYAIDKDAIAKAVGHGFLETANQASIPEQWTYNPDVVGYPYDPDKARELLAEAGYPDGFDTELSYAVATDYIELACTAIQRYLADVGIRVTLQPLTQTAYVSAHSGGWKDSLMQTTATLSIGFPQITALQLNMTSMGPYDVSQYHPVAAEDLLRQAKVEPDQAKMAELMQQMQKVLFDEECVATPIFVGVNIAAKNPKVHGDGMYDPSGDNWTPWYAWMEK